MFTNYLKIAWRNISKNKIFSAIHILGLSLSITVCMLITLFIKDELSFDRFQSNKDEIYRLVIDSKLKSGHIEAFGSTGMVQGSTFKNQIPEIENLVRIVAKTYNLRYKNEVFIQEATQVDSGFFSVFDAQFIEGNAHTALKSPYSIVISEITAKRIFGNEKALGKTVELEFRNEFIPFSIGAVTKNYPQNSTIQIDMLVPFDYSKPMESSWLNIYVNTYFKIKKGTDLAGIENKFAAIASAEGNAEIKKARREWNFDGDFKYKLKPFLTAHLDREHRPNGGSKASGNKLFSYFLAGISLFILIIACTNFINISISHSMQRSKEIGVRKVMGGNRSDLLRQFLGESFLLTALAFMVSMVWVQIALPSFNSLINKSLAFDYLLDGKLMMIFVVLFFTTSMLAGFYPSLVLSGYRPVDTLYGRFKIQGKNILQKSLIVFQYGLAVFFVILTIIQLRQVDLFRSKPLGYNPENLIVLNTHSSDKDKGELLMNELSSNPDILSVAARNDGIWNTQVTVNGSEQLGPDMNVINETYNTTLGLKMIEGRSFSKDFPADSNTSVYVNEAFVKAAGWKGSALGKAIKVMNRDAYTVIGVVRDYHFSSLYELPRPQIFTCNLMYGSYGNILIRVRDGNVSGTLAYIKEKFNMIFPAKPFTYDFQSSLNEKNYIKEKQMTSIIKISAGIMIFISCMGVFGLSILATEKRKKEIGIRKVLGAGIPGIVKDITMEFILLVVIAFALFSPLAYWVGNSLYKSYPYRITITMDIFIICLGGLLMITLITVAYHSLKAAWKKPVLALRTE